MDPVGLKRTVVSSRIIIYYLTALRAEEGHLLYNSGRLRDAFQLLYF